MQNDRLLIIGVKPENHGIGGVTIHVQRLLDFLDNKHMPYSFLDYKIEGTLQLVKGINKSEVVHLHVSNPIYQFLLTVLCRAFSKSVIVTIHGNYGRFNKIYNLLVRSTIKIANVPIVINSNSYDVCKKFNKRLEFISAFIPPQKIEILQREIYKLLEKLHYEGRKIVSTNAYNVSYDKDGHDVYGIDFLVQYFSKRSDMALIVSDPSGNYTKCYSNLNCDSVFFVNYPHPYFELLKHVDFFVRNTSTDGDSLSVKEALFLGVPTICSDVVDRPKGVRLFKYCDELTFDIALNSPSKENFLIDNGAIKIYDIYLNVLS